MEGALEHPTVKLAYAAHLFTSNLALDYDSDVWSL